MPLVYYLNAIDYEHAAAKRTDSEIARRPEVAREIFEGLSNV